jgi:hypothetical protein
LYKDLNPSSLEIVVIVPTNPLYLGNCVGSANLDYICSLTLAVSIGIVNSSAVLAAMDAAAQFFRKKSALDSPSLLFVFIF